MAKLVGARVYNSSAISVNDSTVTALTFDSERFDTDGIHSTVSATGRLTCQTAGKYVITGHVEFATDNDGLRLVTIRLNGATDIADFRIGAAQGVATRMSVSTIYELSASDYVELVVLHNAGAALNVNATGNYSPEFAMHRVG